MLETIKTIINTLKMYVDKKTSDLDKSINKSINNSINNIDNKADNIDNKKMDKKNPTGTGSFSMNRKAGTTIGNNSHAEGNSTTASGNYSHAEGDGTTAFGWDSHAEGYATTASGNNSHAQGAWTTASGHASHAEGYGTTASGDNSHAQGKYNINDVDADGNPLNTYAHVVGNGISNAARSNAHTLDWEGNAWYQGDVYVGSTSGTNIDEGSKKLATLDDVTNALGDVDLSNIYSKTEVDNAITAATNNVQPKDLVATITSEFKDGSLVRSCDVSSADLWAAHEAGRNVIFNVGNLVFSNAEFVITASQSDSEIKQVRLMFVNGSTAQLYVVHEDDSVNVTYYNFLTTANLKQETGTDRKNPMSQKAVTSALDLKADKATVDNITNTIEALDFKSDWNQNDETADDYIKNRPFSEEIVWFTYAESQTITIDGGSASFETADKWPSVGDKYIVVFDGDEYEGVVWEDGDACYRYDFTTKDGVEVEVLDYSLSADGLDGEHTLEIRINTEVVHKLNNKYIDFPVESVNGKTGRIRLNASDIGAATENDVNRKLDKNNPSGSGSFAMNKRAGTSGENSFAVGYNSLASGGEAHAEGNYVTASGFSAHAEGSHTTASGRCSHAEGDNTIASGSSAHAEGFYTLAAGEYQHVQGKYNIKDENNTYAHIVGNGLSSTYRKNAHTLDWDGNAWFQGEVKIGGASQNDTSAKTLATTEYVDSSVAALVDSAPATLDTLGELATAFEENQEVVEALDASITNKANISDLTTHTSNTSNPHNVTTSQLGMSTETWTFTLNDGTTVTKNVVVM